MVNSGAGLVAQTKLSTGRRDRLNCVFKFSFYIEMVEPTCEQFMRWAQAGKPVHVVQLDNAGENKLLKK